MSPESITRALTKGSMQREAAILSASEIRALSLTLAGKPFGGENLPPQAFCSGAAPPFTNPLATPHWNGWGVDSANTRSQPAVMAGLSAEQIPRLKLKWAFALPGVTRMYAQPTVAGGRLFFGSTLGKVFSVDAASGCIRWIFDAGVGVRTAITLGPIGTPSATPVGGSIKWAAYFGTQMSDGAHVYAVDAATGHLIWKATADDSPLAIITGAPTLADGKLVVPITGGEDVPAAAPDFECCKFRGSLVALDSQSGRQIWKSYTISEPARPTRKNKKGTQLWGPSGVGIWSAPTIDLRRRAVYVGTGDSHSDPAAGTSDSILAFHLDTGRFLWSKQMTPNDAWNAGCVLPDQTNCPQANGPDLDFAASPILVDLPNGRRVMIAGQKSGIVHALDPDSGGEILWQFRVGKGGPMGGVQWGPAAAEGVAYVAVSDVLPPASAPGPDGTALATMTYRLGGLMNRVHDRMLPRGGGGLIALHTKTGEKVWYAPPVGCGMKPGCSSAQSAAVTHIPGVVFSGSMDGHLRAYSTRDGRILWDADTARAFASVTGVKGRGGSLDGPGPVVVGGVVYVNSGYTAFAAEMPGNVLLAFSIEGK